MFLFFYNIPCRHRYYYETWEQLHEIAYLQFPGLVWQTLVPALYTAWNLLRQHISTYIAAGPPGSSTAQPSTHYGGRCFGNQVSDSDDVVSAPVCCYTKWCSSGSLYLCYRQPAFGFNGFHYANRPTVLFYWWYVVYWYLSFPVKLPGWKYFFFCIQASYI